MKRGKREMVRSGLLPILTLASVVDFGRLVPPPKRLDCPRCRRSKMQGEHGHRYCQGCGYITKPEPADNDPDQMRDNGDPAGNQPPT